MSTPNISPIPHEPGRLLPGGLLLVGAALLAALGLSGRTDPTGGGGSAPASEDDAGSLRASLEGGPLEPLRAFLGVSEPPRPAAAGSGKPADAGGGEPAEGLAALLKTRIKGKECKLEFMIATIPDPVESAFASWFDSYADALQKALRVEDFVLDRYYLPWAAKVPKGRPHLTTPGSLLFRNADISGGGGRAAAGLPGRRDACPGHPQGSVLESGRFDRLAG